MSSSRVGSKVAGCLLLLPVLSLGGLSAAEVTPERMQQAIAALAKHAQKAMADTGVPGIVIGQIECSHRWAQRCGHLTPAFFFAASPFALPLRDLR